MKLRSRTVTNIDGTFVVLENDGIGGDLVAGKRWEPHFAAFCASLSIAGTTAVDVGANIGCNTVHLAKAVGPTGLVIAFEPQRIPFQQLCGTVILSGYPNVIALPQAVGDRHELIHLQPVDYFAAHVNIGNTGLGKGGDAVEMVTLDSFGIQNLSVLKLDIQGSELMAIQGARQTIQRERPLIFLEIEADQLRDRGTTPAALIAEVFALDYILLHIVNDYPVDFIAVPKERQLECERFSEAVQCKTVLCGP